MKIRLGIRTLAACGALLLTADVSLAQVTTNALDQASDAAYAGLGAPNGLGAGGQNGGYGFGPWTFTLNGNGGSFIQGNGPSGQSFDLWNTGAGGSTIAVRPFTTPLAAGESFSVQLRLNSLDNFTTTNMLALEDASGNILFAYWHTGFEANANNGSYADAHGVGSAVNFTYSYQQFKRFTFTLTSATTYTFTDNTTGATVSGMIAGAPVARVAFIRYNGGGGTGNGQDFQFDQLMVTSAGPPNFSDIQPGPDTLSAPAAGPIRLTAVSGGIPLKMTGASMKVDGAAVTPVISGSEAALTVSYSPSPVLSAASLHTAEVAVEDANGTRYTNAWSFETGHPSLPVTVPGPLSASNNVDVVLFRADGEGWFGTNYGPASTKTLYARFSVMFESEAAEGQSTWGGFQFWDNNTERRLIAKAGGSLGWSMAAGGLPDEEASPLTFFATGEWHTFAVRVDCAAGAPDAVSVWLDPDFSLTEAQQPNPPTVDTLDNSFNNIRLRAGFTPALAHYTNIVVAETSAGIGFATPLDPQFTEFVPTPNATHAAPATPISVKIRPGTFVIDTPNITLNVDGTDVTPTFVTDPSSITVNYQPPTPFALGSSHSVTVNLTDANSTPYSTSWFFTVDTYPSTLPLVLAESTNGIIEVTGGGFGTTIWSSDNGWLDGNYGPDSSRTLYTRFTMNFQDMNGETGDGGAYGGLHFYRGNTEVLLIGNNWGSLNWSIDVLNAPDIDIAPTPIVPGEWHTFVVKTVFAPQEYDSVSIWMDPDFTKSESQQPAVPATFLADVWFDNIHLRAGNGTTLAQYTNVMVAATATDIGFAPYVAPPVLTIGRSSASVTLSWTGGGTLEEAPSPTGPWADAANQTNPQTVPAVGAGKFFRVRK